MRRQPGRTPRVLLGLLAGQAALATARSSPQCGPIEDGVDYFVDGDWSAQPKHATSAELCCEHCRRERRCQSYSYVASAGGENASSSGCWLKGGPPMRKEIKKGVVSGQVLAHAAAARDGAAPSGSPSEPADGSPSGPAAAAAAEPAGAAAAAAGPQGAAEGAQGQCQPVEQDVHYVAEEGWNHTLSGIPDPDLCCMKCHQEDLCQAWTWIEDAGLDGDVPSQCLMLGMAVQKKEYRKGEVSGILLGRAMMLLPPEGGGGGGGAKAGGARGESGKADEHSPNYNGHCQEATPCISGQFFCMEGLSRGSCSPLKAAKFYDGDHGCELFCGVGGSASPGEGPEAAAPPVRGGGPAALLQAISYTPVPVKEPLLAPGASLDWADFATANTSALWSQQVRGDLAIMRALGANVVRVRGADGAANHRPFLNEATAQGLGVITEFGEFPYVQLKYSCLRTNMDCFAQAKSLHAAHLNSGLLSSGGGSYHSAVHTVVLMVDPDTRVQEVLSEGPGGADELKGLFIKAIVSALDGLLEAEASLKVGGALPNVTVSFSFATCEVCKHLGDKPALGQMAELREAVQRPEDYGYAPRNDLWAAYQSRFVNSVSTDLSADDFREYFMDTYDQHFQDTPVFISEYRANGLLADSTDALRQMVDVARGNASMLLGLALPEFQARKDRGEGAQVAGIFELGDKALAKFTLGISTYVAWCLEPTCDPEAGVCLPRAVADAFGGQGLTGSEVGVCPQTSTSTTTTQTTSTVTTSTRTTSTSTKTMTSTKTTTSFTTTTRTTTTSEPSGEMRGFLSFVSAAITQTQAQTAVRASLALWYNVPEEQLTTVKVFETRRLQEWSEGQAPAEPRLLVGSWMVSYRIQLHYSQYDYVIKVATAISSHAKPFAQTLADELVKAGGDDHSVRSSCEVISFTDLEGERITTPSTSTTTVTSTMPWKALVGFLTLVVPDADKEQVEKAVQSSLVMRLDLHPGEFYTISAFESGRRLLREGVAPEASLRRLVGVGVPGSRMGPVRWEVSYVLRVPERFLEKAKGLAMALNHDSATFKSTLISQLAAGGHSEEALRASLEVVTFAKLQVDSTKG